MNQTPRELQPNHTDFFRAHINQNSYFLRATMKKYYKIKVLKKFFSNDTDIFRELLPNYADFFRVHINKY